jgi:hypothetical protein
LARRSRRTRGGLRPGGEHSDAGGPHLAPRAPVDLTTVLVHGAHRRLPRLTVANGPSPERLEKQQRDVLTSLNEALAPFRILTRIACDISADHSLDRTDELLGRPEVLVRRERP